MADDVDKPERYLIRDTKTGIYKNYDGYSTASRARNAVDKLDNAYGAYRYKVVPYSIATAGSFENPDTSKAKSVTSSARGGSGRAGPSFSPEGGMKPGQSPSLDNPIMQAKGGSVSSRGDGIAQRGKTKGRMC
jgi:hypothetical protein